MASKKIVKKQTIDRIARYKGEYTTVKEFKKSEEFDSLLNGFMNAHEREHADTIIKMVYDGRSYDDICRVVRKKDLEMHRESEVGVEAVADDEPKKSETSESFFMASQGKVIEVDPVYVIIGDDESTEENIKTVVAEENTTAVNEPVNVDNSVEDDDAKRYASFWNAKQDEVNKSEKSKKNEAFFMASQGKVVESDITQHYTQNVTTYKTNTTIENRGIDCCDDTDEEVTGILGIFQIMSPNTYDKYFGKTAKAHKVTMNNFTTLKGIIRSVISDMFNVPETSISDKVISWIGNVSIEESCDKFDICETFTDDVIHRATKAIRKWIEQNKTSVGEAIAS